MKKKHNEGFSLVEVLVAIVILGIFVVPTCSSLIMTFQMNQKTAQMLKAQQAVSSAVETLKAEGIKGTTVAYFEEKCPGIDAEYLVDNLTNMGSYYTLKIRSEDINSVEVETAIRNTVSTPVNPGGGS